jgi:hypothetical protein
METLKKISPAIILALVIVLSFLRSIDYDGFGIEVCWFLLGATAVFVLLRNMEQDDGVKLGQKLLIMLIAGIVTVLLFIYQFNS